jgi:hypothetical protein
MLAPPTCDQDSEPDDAANCIQRASHTEREPCGEHKEASAALPRRAGLAAHGERLPDAFIRLGMSPVPREQPRHVLVHVREFMPKGAACQELRYPAVLLEGPLGPAESIVYLGNAVHGDGEDPHPVDLAQGGHSTLEEG